MPSSGLNSPKGMEHVSRRDLYTSLPARIQYLHSFLEFSLDDVEALVEGQKYIKQVIPAIVNIVYKKLLKYDVTARVFTTRDSRSEDPIEDWVTEDSSLIDHRKMFLRWYLSRLNTDPSKMEYWEYLDKVGLMHTGKGRRNPLHVDYVFLGVCLGYIQDSMFEAILSHPKLPLAKKIALVKALGKVIWIQNDLMARWHCSDGAEYADPFENDGSDISDKEGYLHGKKILGDSSSDDASLCSSSSGKTSLGRPIEDAAHLSGSRCPFSGVMRSDSGEDFGDQRATMSKLPLRKKNPETNSEHSTSQPGTPKMHVIDGKTVCDDRLERNPFSENGAIPEN